MKPKVDNFRERALRFVDRLSALESSAREFAAANGTHDNARRRLVANAMDLTAAARTLAGRK